MNFLKCLAAHLDHNPLLFLYMTMVFLACLGYIARLREGGV